MIRRVIFFIALFAFSYPYTPLYSQTLLEMYTCSNDNGDSDGDGISDRCEYIDAALLALSGMAAQCDELDHFREQRNQACRIRRSPACKRAKRIARIRENAIYRAAKRDCRGNNRCRRGKDPCAGAANKDKAKCIGEESAPYCRALRRSGGSSRRKADGACDQVDKRIDDLNDEKENGCNAKPSPDPVIFPPQDLEPPKDELCEVGNWFRSAEGPGVCPSPSQSGDPNPDESQPPTPTPTPSPTPELCPRGLAGPSC